MPHALLAGSRASIRSTLSLHDALPISVHGDVDDPLAVGVEDHAALQGAGRVVQVDDRLRRATQGLVGAQLDQHPAAPRDRKSTRLNSSHVEISYAVFCLKKKNRRMSLL